VAQKRIEHEPSASRSALRFPYDQEGTRASGDQHRPPQGSHTAVAIDETSASLLLEFLVLAKYSEAIRAEIDTLVARIRETQLEALTRTWPTYGLPDDEVSPELLVFLLSAIPKMLLVEEEVGLSTAHAEILNLVKRYIDRIEPLPAIVESPLAGAARRGDRP
jgi:hypothetical protein